MSAIPPPGQFQWTVEGVEPSSAGCKPTVFPLDDTPRHRGSGPAGSRTLNLDFKRVLLCQLSYKAVRAVCRAGVEPAQRMRVGYSHLGSPVPGRHVLSVPWMGFEPMLFTLRERRPLRAGPPGHLSVAQGGVEPLYCAPRTGHENGLGELDRLMITSRFWKPEDGSQHRPLGGSFRG